MERRDGGVRVTCGFVLTFVGCFLLAFVGWLIKDSSEIRN